MVKLRLEEVNSLRVCPVQGWQQMETRNIVDRSLSRHEIVPVTVPRL